MHAGGHECTNMIAYHFNIFTRNCENNQALYRALNLSNILDLEKQLFSANEV